MKYTSIVTHTQIIVMFGRHVFHAPHKCDALPPSPQIAETPNGSFNGSMTLGMNGGVNGGLSNGGINGGISPIDVNGGVWNTQTNASTPGFEDDLPSNGGYMRFSS